VNFPYNPNLELFYLPFLISLMQSGYLETLKIEEKRKDEEQ